MRKLTAAIAVSMMLGLGAGMGAAQAARPANTTEPMVAVHQVPARILASAAGGAAAQRHTGQTTLLAEGAGADARTNQHPA